MYLSVCVQVAVVGNVLMSGAMVALPQFGSLDIHMIMDTEAEILVVPIHSLQDAIHANIEQHHIGEHRQITIMGVDSIQDMLPIVFPDDVPMNRRIQWEPKKY